MNKTRFLCAAVCAALTLAGEVHAQTAIQAISISFLGEYQTNAIHPNAANTGTNIVVYAPNILITSANMIRAIAVELEGENWTIWAGSHLVREVNLATTNEGIFLRKGAIQTNVSRFFDGFSNNFTGNLASDFPNLVNFNSQTNYQATNTYLPPLDVSRGFVTEQPDTNIVDYRATWGLHSLSFHTFNLQFNLVGTSYEVYTNVSGRVAGVNYAQKLKTGTITFGGNFSVNVTSNIFNVGTNPAPVFSGGPIHGTFSINAAAFSQISAPTGP